MSDATLVRSWLIGDEPWAADGELDTVVQACTPPPTAARNSGSGTCSPLASAAVTMAVAMGCSERRSAAAASART